MKKYLLGIIISAVLIFPGCRKSGFDSSHFSLLPEGATALFSVNVQKLVAIPEINRLFQDELKKDNKHFFAAIYQQLEKDLTQASVAIYSPENKPAEMVVILAIKMNYSKEQLLDLLSANKINYSVNNEQAMEMIEIRRGNQPEDLILLFKNNLLLLEKKHLQFFLNARKTKKSVLETAALKNGLKKISPQKLLFLVSAGITDLKSGEVPPGLAAPKEVIAELDYARQAFSGYLLALAKDEQEAQNIVNLINGIKSLVIMGASQKNPQLSSIIQKININAQKNEIKIDFNLTIQELENLKNLK